MSRKVEQVTYTKCASTKRGSRIWIEGTKLKTAGFERYAPYTKSTGSAGIILKLDPEGDLKVAGRARNGKDVPIIDLSAQTIEPFNVGDSLRVVFETGVITITKHHEDQKQDLREKSLREAIQTGNVTEASLFTGGGVSTMAINDGIKSVTGGQSKVKYVVDQELKYLQVAGSNNYAIDDDTVFISGDVEEVETCWFKQVNVLSFSMPCAGYSKSGKSKHGLDPIEHSGTAIFGVVNAIKHSNPAVIISENVVEAKDSPSYQLLKAELQRTGYKVEETVLNNTQTDSIEKRNRYWLVAVSDGLVDELDINLPAVARSGTKLSDVFEGGEYKWSDNAGLKAKAIRDAAAGKGFKRQLLTGDETECGTIGRFYNKNRSTEPHIVSDQGERLLTPVEHARVKSIPEELVANVVTTTAHEILGQSIDYLQAFKLAAITFTQIIQHNEGIAL